MLAPDGRGIDTDPDAGPVLKNPMNTHHPQHRVPPLHPSPWFLEQVA